MSDYECFLLFTIQYKPTSHARSEENGMLGEWAQGTWTVGSVDHIVSLPVLRQDSLESRFSNKPRKHWPNVTFSRMRSSKHLINISNGGVSFLNGELALVRLKKSRD